MNRLLRRGKIVAGIACFLLILVSGYVYGNERLREVYPPAKHETSSVQPAAAEAVHAEAQAEETEPVIEEAVAAEESLETHHAEAVAEEVVHGEVHGEEHGEAQGEEGHGEHKESGLAAIEPGFLLHFSIPVIFPKDPACDHSNVGWFKKVHHTSDCGVPHPVVVAWLIMVILITVSYLGSRDLQVIPGRFQAALEALVDGINGLLEDMIGHNGHHYRALIGTLALYIFSSNLSGLVPGLASPSANLSNNIALALIVFFFTHFAGFRHQGVHYLKHFTGETMALAPLMVPLHIIGELARPLSLSMRLFGNIFGEELVIMILFFLVPYIAPLPMMAFAIFGGLIQTAVFVLLSTVYIAGAASHGE